MVVVLVVVGVSWLQGRALGSGLAGAVAGGPVGTTTVDGALTGPVSPCVSVPVAVAVSVTKPRSTSCWRHGIGRVGGAGYRGVGHQPPNGWRGARHRAEGRVVNGDRREGDVARIGDQVGVRDRFPGEQRVGVAPRCIRALDHADCRRRDDRVLIVAVEGSLGGATSPMASVPVAVAVS